MENEWLELAYINYDKVIMHGQIATAQIDQVLTQEQIKEVADLNFKHEREMRKLLKSFLM